MLDVLICAGCFVAIIVLGYFLKKIGFFREEDFTVLSRITLRITLPAAIIVSFGGKEIDSSLLMLVLLAAGCGLIYLGIGYFGNLRNSKERRAFEMLNLPGYNIGTFVIPFAQSFLGPVGVIATSIFDTGNSLICLGGAYSLARMVQEGQKFSVKRFAQSLLRSAPFVCYVIMLTMNLARISVPGPVMSCATIIGNANAFMAMLTIGVGFKVEADREQLGTMARLLAIRYGIAAVLAWVFYFYLPFSQEVRQTLVILVLSPISSAVPAFTGELKGNVGLSSAMNSISIVVSIVVIVTMLTIML